MASSHVPLKARYPSVPEPVVLHLAATSLGEPDELSPPLAHTALPLQRFAGALAASPSQPPAQALFGRDISPLTDIETDDSGEELSASTQPWARAKSPTVSPDQPIHVGAQRKVERPTGATRLSEEELGKLLATSAENQRLLKTFLLDQIREHLNPTETISSQDKESLSQVKSKAAAEFPFLNNFRQGWMLDCLLTRLLARTSQKKENKEIRMQKKAEVDIENITQQVARQVTRQVDRGGPSRRR